jgi:hypothetical protein
LRAALASEKTYTLLVSLSDEVSGNSPRTVFLSNRGYCFNCIGLAFEPSVIGNHDVFAVGHAVTKAAADGAIKGTESFPAKMRLEIAGLQVNVEFNGDINLQ